MTEMNVQWLISQTDLHLLSDFSPQPSCLCQIFGEENEEKSVAGNCLSSSRPVDSPSCTYLSSQKITNWIALRVQLSHSQLEYGFVAMSPSDSLVSTSSLSVLLLKVTTPFFFCSPSLSPTVAHTLSLSLSHTHTHTHKVGHWCHLD